MTARIELLVTLALVAWCFVGCARGPTPAMRRLYGGPPESLDGITPSALAGRTIVIDPGHGGVFRGARGAAGLDEADANLGVAVHLARMLSAAGAQVTLTRETDCDFVGGDSLRLRDDLRARVEISNKIDPDLFISLHHNADLKFDPAFNEIQVYYRLDDDGPSLDAARAIARRLIRNLREDKCRVIGGNYHVLRNSVAPAVLCEASFITNPVVEDRLKSDDKQMLEAKAYFLGLVDYFSRGVPRVVGLGASERGAPGRPAIWLAFDAASVIDARSVELTLDGASLEARRFAGNLFLAHPPHALRGGSHTLAARARNLGGNASRRASAELLVRLEPASLTLSACPPAGAEAGPRKLAALVLDANGNAVADSTRVVFTWKDGGATARAERLTSAGAAAVYAGRDIPDVKEIAARCGGLTAALDLASSPGDPGGSGPEAGAKLQPSTQARDGAPAPAAAAHWIAGFVTDAGGNGLAGALVTATPGPQGVPDSTEADASIGEKDPTGPEASAPVPVSAVTDTGGFYALAGGGPPAALEASKPGYRSATVDLIAATGGTSTGAPAGFGAPALAPATLVLERFYPALDGAPVVAIDAAGGAALNERTGPEGIEASSVNLAVALTLKSLLESVGVRAVLTRETEENTTGEDRVRRAEAAHPGLLVSISHSGAAGTPAVVSHYPGSTSGARASRLIADEIRAGLGLEAQTGETADYIVQQPSAAAVKVNLPAAAPRGSASAGPEDARRRAYALMCGVLRYLGVDQGAAFSIGGRVTIGGEPCPGALVAIDGALEIVADSEGRFEVRLLERGPHTAEVLGLPGRSSGKIRNAADAGARVTFDENTGTLALDAADARRWRR